MKVKGLLVSQAICDRRPFVHPEARLRWLSSAVTTDRTFLRGFGAGNERFKLRIPWRAQDSVYLDCSHAISLPDRLPIDNRPIYRTVRRLYVDRGALARFEFGIFIHPKHSSPRSTKRLDEYARAFWNVSVKRIPGSSIPIPLCEAFQHLLRSFVRSTTPHSAQPRYDLCECREPLLQVIVEITSTDQPANATRLDEDGKVWLRLEHINQPRQQKPLQVLYLFNRKNVDFEWRRKVRAHVAWLHADFEILAHLLDVCTKEAPTPSLLKYMQRLAAGLRAAPHFADADYLAVSALAATWEKLYDNRRARTLETLETVELPRGLKDELRGALEPIAPKAGFRPKSSQEQAEQLQALELGILVEKIVTLEDENRRLNQQVATGQPAPPVEAVEAAQFGDVQSRRLYAAVGQTRREVTTPEAEEFLHAEKEAIANLAQRFRMHFTSPTPENIATFLSQLETQRRMTLGLQLLQNVDFFDDSRIGQIFNEFYFQVLSSEVREKAVFSALGGPQDSSYLVNYFCSKVFLEGTRPPFRNLTDIIRSRNPESTTVVLIDDNLGSGKQATRILREWLGVADSPYVHVEPLAQDEVQWLRNSALHYFVVVGFMEGIQVLGKAARELGVHLEVKPAILCREIDGCFKATSRVFSDPTDRREARDMARQIGYELLADKAWTPELRQERALGYGDSQKLLAFSYNTPTCTLPMLWKRGKFGGRPWTPLFPRRS
jgi:hypothetical protein